MLEILGIFIFEKRIQQTVSLALTEKASEQSYILLG